MTISLTIQTIPLNQLVPSAANVRKTGAHHGIEELAASIEAHGLLQNLQVRPIAKGRYEVIAGSRRLSALKILMKQKKLPKDFDVPCHILGEDDAHEISLAENVVRLAMHPADQFTAFQVMVAQGKGVEDIAARFGVTAAIVRQRLKLAAVSPELVELYRQDEMSLDQLMAFTVSDDHAAQEAAWFGQPDYLRRPSAIRASLTAAQIEADDRRVKFVGLEAYREAGGGLNRDLFQPEHEGYLTDPALLDRLVAERLEQAAATLREQGWKWVTVTPRRTYEDTQGFGHLRAVRLPLNDDQQQQRQQLLAEYDALVVEHGEEPEEEIADRLADLWAEIERIDDAALGWRDEDRAIAGVLVSIGYKGDLDIEEGLVRPEDRPKPVLVASTDEQGGETPRPSPLSARLTESLTAERTAALRAMMIDNQSVAMATLCHALALPLFYHPMERFRSCVTLKMDVRDLRRSADWIDDSPAHILLHARQAEWQKRLPEEAADLFAWLLRQEAATLTCTSSEHSRHSGRLFSGEWASSGVDI